MLKKKRMKQARVCETNVLTGNVQHFVEKEIITSCCDSVSHSINLETVSPPRSHYSAGGTCNILVHIHLYIYTVEIYIATHIRTSFEPSDMSLWHTHTHDDIHEDFELISLLNLCKFCSTPSGSRIRQHSYNW